MEMKTTSEEVTSPNLLNVSLEKCDDGDVGLSPLSSQYSSCGESEFDRYCSANSVMGTPSVCSSMGFFHDSLDSDVGSLKGSEAFTLGGNRVPKKFEDSSRLTTFGRDHNSSSFPNDASFEGSSPRGDYLGSSPSSHGVLPILGSNAEPNGVKGFDCEVGKKENLAVLLKNVENVFLQGAVAARSAAENLLDSNLADEMEDERCREEDETSSRYEHSDGEDSMFNYGSDDGFQPHAYHVKKVDNKSDEDGGCENMVLMNSSVAFGSKDWEDFELDGTEENKGIQLPDNFWERPQLSGENENNSPDLSLERSTCKDKMEMEVTAGSSDLLVDGKSFEGQKIYSTASLQLLGPGLSNHIANNDGSDEYLESCSMYNIFENQCSPIHVPEDMRALPCEEEIEIQDVPCDRASGFHERPVLQKRMDRPLDLGVAEASSSSVDVYKDHRFDNFKAEKVKSHFEHVSNSVSSLLENEKGRNSDDLNLPEDKFTINNEKDFEMGAFCDEIVHDMEDILLDSCDSVIMRLKQKRTMLNFEQSSPVTDGRSTTNTIGLDDGYPMIRHPFNIDGIEVVGAKQRKGDVSFSERLVGVREYTVYVIHVWSGNKKWEVERRYRDFYTLYRRLKTYFAAQEWILPPPWSSVEKESKKLFGNASPHVVSERSTLIQDCLSSIIQFRYFSSLPSALVWFLSPSAAILSSSQSNDMAHQPETPDVETISTLGKTISLIVDLQPQKSMKELLDKQQYTCAGCHKDFDDGRTRMLEFLQSFGWDKPRYCEYTGQLFCSSCHKNETAVLPARVLHHWDFSPYTVSQMAKSYLDSIVDKPMLCVSAANPFLFSKVPTLLHIVGVRRKIGTMLSHIRCTYRRSIYRRLGYRKYLLETNDFFALRDLVDLSKGAFAALPAILEAVLNKMQEHITELCLECCDNGIPCSARQACSIPSSLIFPFQEEQEIQRCKTCNSVFHKSCFTKLSECPCGVVFKETNSTRSLAKLKPSNASSEVGSSSAKRLAVKSPVEFISGLFFTSRQEKIKDHKDGDNVILMGSLPSNAI